MGDNAAAAADDDDDDEDADAADHDLDMLCLSYFQQRIIVYMYCGFHATVKIRFQPFHLSPGPRIKKPPLIT